MLLFEIVHDVKNGSAKSQVYSSFNFLRFHRFCTVLVVVSLLCNYGRIQSLISTAFVSIQSKDLCNYYLRKSKLCCISSTESYLLFLYAVTSASVVFGNVPIVHASRVGKLTAPTTAASIATGLEVNQLFPTKNHTW